MLSEITRERAKGSLAGVFDSTVPTKRMAENVLVWVQPALTSGVNKEINDHENF